MRLTSRTNIIPRPPGDSDELLYSTAIQSVPTVIGDASTVQENNTGEQLLMAAKLQPAICGENTVLSMLHILHVILFEYSIQNNCDSIFNQCSYSFDKVLFEI